jgi:hypothetical protein
MLEPKTGKESSSCGVVVVVVEAAVYSVLAVQERAA